MPDAFFKNTAKMGVNSFANVYNTDTRWEEEILQHLPQDHQQEMVNNYIEQVCTINHHKNEEQIDLEYNIKQVEDNFSKQRALRDCIANKTSTLIKGDLLFKDEDGFIFDEFVGLTKKSIKLIILL